jgi:hypothetical protein
VTTKNGAKQRWEQAKLEGWTQALARWTTGILTFLTLTGLSIFFLPFSLFNQHAVLAHTVVGLLFTLPILVFLVRHVRTYWDFPLTHTKFTGWMSGAMGGVCIASGVALSWQAALGTRISYAWRAVHIVTTFGLIAFLAPHLVAVVWRERRFATPAEARPLLAGFRVHLRRAGLACAAGLAATGALCFAFPAVSLHDEFPAEYEKDPYGSGPFAPSLARTATGGAIDPRSLSDSAACGSAGCHEEIYREWQPSAHRYAAIDVGFQAIQGVMAAQNGPVSTRYCGGCHDPISLFSGTKNIGVEDLTALPGIQEGISCVSCHAIEQTDVKGNANYVMAPPERYAFELREGRVAKALSDFLIRA